MVLRLLHSMALRSKMVAKALCALCSWAAESVATSEDAIARNLQGAACCRAGTGERERWRWYNALCPSELESLWLAMVEMP